MELSLTAAPDEAATTAVSEDPFATGEAGAGVAGALSSASLFFSEPTRANASLSGARAVRPRTLELHIAPAGDFRFTTTFIGSAGEVLLETTDNPAVYSLTEDVGYVRARVRNSRSDYAWTQPVFVTRR